MALCGVLSWSYDLAEQKRLHSDEKHSTLESGFCLLFLLLTVEKCIPQNVKLFPWDVCDVCANMFLWTWKVDIDTEGLKTLTLPQFFVTESWIFRTWCKAHGLKCWTFCPFSSLASDWCERATVYTGESFFHLCIWSSDAQLTPCDHVTGLQLVISKSCFVPELMRQQRLKSAQNSSWSTALVKASCLSERKREAGWPSVRVTATVLLAVLFLNMLFLFRILVIRIIGSCLWLPHVWKNKIFPRCLLW